MKLWAVSDLHVRHAENRQAVEEMPHRPDDWLILGGDLCETVDELAFVLDVATRRYARVFWIPGNHELWTTRSDEPRGDAKYRALVDACRTRGVLTPEDPYAAWPGPGGPHIIAPLFLLYDYTFRPASVTLEGAVDWARESGIVCADELYLHPDPHPSRQAWCDARIAATLPRLEEAARQAPLVLVNHFPMLRELADVPLYPRFTLWCGTVRTHDWHRRFRARVVVTGHLHMPSTRMIDGVRFEEVSFGYPRQRARRPGGLDRHLREILPGPA